MVDTVRTIAQILALYADNTSGDISPQDARDMIVSLQALAPSISTHANITAQGVGSGDFYLLGYYDCPAADSNLDELGTTQAHGTANSSYAAHAIVVASGVGTTDGSDLVLKVSGTSITDTGVRTATDFETIVADCTASSTDQYYETVKKWIGQITYTLTSSGGSTFNYDFNYGFTAYEDFANSDFTLESFVMDWLGGGNDAGFDIEIHHHKDTGWTYSAAAFDAGPTPIYTMTGDHVTETELKSGDYGRWKRINLSDAISGSLSEGLVVHLKTTSANSLQWCNMALNVHPIPS